MTSGRWIVIIVVFLLQALALTQCTLSSSENMNQTNDPPQEIKAESWKKTGKSSFNPKLSSSLNRVLAAHQRGGTAEAKIFAQNHNMVFQDGRIQVTIVVTTEEAIDDVRVAVNACGGDYQLHYRTFLQAMVPVPALVILAQRPDVENIREPQRAILQQ